MTHIMRAPSAPAVLAVLGLLVSPAAAQSCRLRLRDGTPKCNGIKVASSNAPGCNLACAQRGVDVIITGTGWSLEVNRTVWYSASFLTAPREPGVADCDCDYSGGGRYPNYIAGSRNFTWQYDDANLGYLEAPLPGSGTPATVLTVEDRDKESGLTVCREFYDVVAGTCFGVSVAEPTPNFTINLGALIGIIIAAVVVCIIVPIVLVVVCCSCTFLACCRSVPPKNQQTQGMVIRMEPQQTTVVAVQPGPNTTVLQTVPYPVDKLPA